MRIKDDYMKNGQPKADYNVQHATEGQYAFAYVVFPNPTDTRTLIPFLDHIEGHYFKLPTHIVGNVGYDSEENYDYIIHHKKRILLMPYNQYRKEQEKKFKNNPFNIANCQYNAELDAFTCPNDKKLTFRYVSKRTDRNGYNRKFKIYECESCTGCPFRTKCTKAKAGRNRRIFYNENWKQQKTYIKELLSNEEIGEIYRNGKIDVEPVFGFLKANLCFTRFSVRGKEKVRNELGFALMAVNLRKYTAKKNNQKTNDESFSTKKRFQPSFFDD